MKLITKAIAKQLSKYPMYSQDSKGEDAIAVCKFFNPCGSQTWYILEAEQIGNDYRFFTLFESNYGREYGYVMLSELEAIRLPFGLRIERDIYFTPCTIREIN